MEDEEQHQHEYGGGGGSNNMADLRHFFSPRPLMPTPLYPPPPAHTLFSTSTSLQYNPHQYEMMAVMGGGRPDNVLQGAAPDFQSDSTTTTTSTMPASVAVGGGEGSSGAAAAGSSGLGGVGTTRWPRQETLTLLEVRSRLDHKFKEANHKGPLWDQISRIMCEEHGYQRSGKKCREKFENLYKYYKKTKDGKAGRQDGKHYRFFRHLEALYGETDHTHSNLNTSAANNNNNDYDNTTSNQHHYRSISLSDDSSSELHTSSSDDNKLNRVGLLEVGGGRKRWGKRSWKSKIKDFIDLKMRKIMEKQEAWLEKMMRTVEHKEKERMSRDEEWRSHESERVEREHMLWTKERAWIEARDRAFMDGLQKLISGKELAVEDKDLLSSSDHSEELHMNMMAAANRTQRQQSKHKGKKNNLDHEDIWAESEIIELIQLKARMDARFEHCGGSELEGDLWDEIATRMTSLGYDQRSAEMYEEKYWDLINAGHLKGKECHKKRKENWRIESVDYSNSSHPQTSESNRLYSYGGEINGPRGMGLVPPEIGLGGGGGLNPMTDSFKFLLGNDGDSHLLGSYGIKPNKGN